MRVTAHSLAFRYQADTPVLDDVTFDVPEGCSAAILGPSGSGKTTLVSILGGLISPQDGQFSCFDVAGARHEPRDVATWILQTVSLLPDRSVRDNVCIGAYLDGATLSEAVDRAMRALDQVGLGHHASAKARELSGGEAQRVAIARALASRRPVIFADEPTGNLDRANTDRVLSALFAGARRTILLVTHDEAAAARCDLAFRLVDGRIVPTTVTAA